MVEKRKLQIKDLPKDALVAIVEAAGVPVRQDLIAGAIIEARLKKAAGFADQYEKTVKKMKTCKSAVKRRGLNVDARRQIYNAETLFASAKRMAAENGLTEKYFGAEKEAAGAPTPAR
jgi:2-C-methyl-D-erythritol 4-phosphate cytidylyltransferase